jgi:hypothetical protein|eukprot:COSAG01_NODE_3447_length_6079_cov_12.927343_8_plen_69_part_00
MLKVCLQGWNGFRLRCSSWRGRRGYRLPVSASMKVSTRQLCSQRLLIRRMQGNKGMKGLHFVLCGRKW